MSEAVLSGLGAYLPRRVVTNDDLAERLDTSHEWIMSRVGIRERRIAGEGESPIQMGIRAGANALEAAGVEPYQVDLVIVSTCTMETVIPHAAPQVAQALGIESPGAFDVTSGCSGFNSALSSARALVASGAAEHVLVVSTERMSDWLDWQDRSVCVLLGDAAAAAVVSVSDVPGIGHTAWGSEAADAGVLGIPSRTGSLAMDGRSVYRWTSTIAPVARQALKLAGMEVEDLAGFVPHQANARIIDVLCERLEMPDSVHVARDIEWSGNTSSASVPLALTRALAAGDLAPGDPVLLFGFGAGLACAAQVVITPELGMVDHD